MVQYGQTLVGKLLRQLQVQAREAIKRYQRLPEWCGDWPQALKNLLARQQRSALQPVFNLSGTAVTLEYDLDGAERGHRDQAIADLLCQLTRAEDACIVNNNATAVLLMLAAIAPGKQVVVSRGELVEIGGAFRIPDVMRQAGCQLVEVGTTNRTHLKDYRNAIGEQTALLMKVQPAIIAFRVLLRRSMRRNWR